MIGITAAKGGVLIESLDAVARAKFGARTSGISTGPAGVTIWLADNASEIEQADAAAILAGLNALVVMVDKVTITADGADTATAQVALADPEFDYFVWLDGVKYAEGYDSVVGGAAIVELTSSIAGEFVVEIRRRIGDYASGHVTVTAEPLP